MAIVFDDVTYLDEIKKASFNIDNSKITGIVGTSNSGKSILIDLMSGFLTCEEGTIYGDWLENEIGVLYQNIEDQFFFNTIGEEFYSALKIKGIHNIDKKIISSLKMFGFNEKILHKSIYDLSLSEQKKIALALVLALNPKILLLDEPTFGLDNKDKERFIKLVRMMKIRYGKTIVIASRDTDLIHKLADKVILINDGKVVKAGDKYDVLTDEKTLFECDLYVPKVIKFSNLVLKKKSVNIGYRDDINDLVKDIFRFIRWF